MKQIQITNSTDYEQSMPHMIDRKAPMIFDVVVKYYDETKERISATVGNESKYCEDILGMFEETNLEYIRIEPSTYWKNKRDPNHDV